ncbi:dihydrofolate reductase [Streptomyces sp. R44]|uniref:Dihydrofolate reductase n=1 Tax=Streptomyces sp. R44 TaxID=3238633 RepID=A0AB39TAI4_9ACTN
MNIGLIWAQTTDGVIGADNTIPWRLPEDMAHFKATTLGHPVIMGRKTWDSLPARFRPLVGRRNIVVTRDAQWTAEGAERAGSIEAALDLAAGVAQPADEAVAWVMGGGEVYRAALPHARTLSVTEIDTAVDGDTYAPTVEADWQAAEDTGWRDSTTGLRYRIRRYTRP